MTIENAYNPARIVREELAAIGLEDKDEDFLDKRGRIRVKRLTKYDDPNRFDKQFEAVLREVKTNVVNIDAKLVEGNRVRHYTNAKEFLRSPTVRRRLQEARAAGRLMKDEVDRVDHLLKDRLVLHMKRELREGESLRGLREHDFEYGYYPDELPASGRVFPITDIALPSLNSPHAKNALLYDYLDAHRKVWEASTFNPIARRIARLIPQFVLGRGVKGATDSRPHQTAWDAFWKLNRMRPRVKQTLKELIIYGEVFWRFFKTKQGLLVRSIDPSTIWDIVTDEDDIEDVKYYHQQYVRMNLMPTMIGVSVPVPSTMVIRQIPAEEVQHYKINATSSEKRGRSELFPILGYLLRFKEFINDRILLNKMRAMFALDVAVEGDESDVTAADEQFSTPPGPAAVLVHNKGIEVEFKNASANANDAATDAEVLLKVIAIGANISENFLGVSRAQTRAGALISTEPDVKNFEDYQELIEQVLMDTAERVFDDAGLAQREMEFTFPAIAQEDRSAKIKDIAFMEAMDYFTKERSATMAAREFQITDYHYQTEQQKIAAERGTEPVIATGLQQVPKIAPDPMGGVSPMGSDLTPEKGGPEPSRVTQTSGQMGFNKGSRGLANTRATLNRTGFTRTGEKIALQNNRTSGTPLRHAAEAPETKRGWSDAARLASLATRRAKALKRQQGES